MDSATLGKVARDFLSDEVDKREKARSLVKSLREHGVHIAFPRTILKEVFRHESDEVFRERFKFFGSLPLIAWVKRYNDCIGPGSIVDISKRELNAFVGSTKADWDEIIASVRDEIWQTGFGEELFADPNHEFWQEFRRYALESVAEERAAASIDKADPGRISNMKLKEVWGYPKRTPDERAKYKTEFARNLESQLEKTADKKLTFANLASQYANDIFKDIEAVAQTGVDLRDWLLHHHGIPPRMIHGEMSVKQLGRLGVAATRLRIVSESLGIDVDLEKVPPDALPTLFLQQELWEVQSGAKVRGEGSNFGDNSLAAFVLYADFVEVDSRTCEYLNQIRKRDARYHRLFNEHFRSSDYASIPRKCGCLSRDTWEEGQAPKGRVYFDLRAPNLMLDVNALTIAAEWERPFGFE